MFWSVLLIENSNTISQQFYQKIQHIRKFKTQMWLELILVISYL